MPVDTSWQTSPTRVLRAGSTPIYLRSSSSSYGNEDTSAHAHGIDGVAACNSTAPSSYGEQVTTPISDSNLRPQRLQRPPKRSTSPKRVVGGVRVVQPGKIRLGTGSAACHPSAGDTRRMVIPDDSTDARSSGVGSQPSASVENPSSSSPLPQSSQHAMNSGMKARERSRSVEPNPLPRLRKTTLYQAHQPLPRPHFLASRSHESTTAFRRATGTLQQGQYKVTKVGGRR